MLPKSFPFKLKSGLGIAWYALLFTLKHFSIAYMSRECQLGRKFSNERASSVLEENSSSRHWPAQVARIGSPPFAEFLSSQLMFCLCRCVDFIKPDNKQQHANDLSKVGNVVVEAEHLPLFCCRSLRRSKRRLTGQNTPSPCITALNSLRQ